VGSVAGKASIAARAPNFVADPLRRTNLDHTPAKSRPGMRGGVLCLIAPATFLTSLGLIEAAITRTMAVLRNRLGNFHAFKGRRISESLESYCAD
jgi:hypothetical protein